MEGPDPDREKPDCSGEMRIMKHTWKRGKLKWSNSKSVKVGNVVLKEKGGLTFHEVFLGERIEWQCKYGSHVVFYVFACLG
jgi:hypothetical protein